MRKKINKSSLLRINKACAYFPCHKNLEDCTFCYCPFYPCENDALGKFIFTKDRRKIWSCMDCSWIHRKKVVDAILKQVRSGFIKPDKNTRKPKAANTGIIILGHGSKLKRANDSLYKIIKEIKGCGFKVIEPAFLQLHNPALHESVGRIIQKGCQNIIIVPFFLFMGNHVKRDVPKIIEKEKKLYPGVNFIYTRNIGSDHRITGIVLDCISEAL